MKKILKFGTSHCGMCKKVSEVFDREGIVYEEIDCEKDEVLAERYNIRNVPVVVVQREEGIEVYANYGEIMKNLEAFR